MFCTKCGAQLPENAAFCTACGATVGGEQTQQAAQTVTPAQPEVDTSYETYTQPVDTTERDKKARNVLIWGILSLSFTLPFILAEVLGFVQILASFWNLDQFLELFSVSLSEHFFKPYEALLPMAPVFGIVSSRIAKGKAANYTSLYGEPIGKAKVSASLAKAGFVLGWVVLIMLILNLCLFFCALGAFLWDLSKWQSM